MADMYAVNGETLAGIANAIRSKTGSDDFMTVASMASAIDDIQTLPDGYKVWIPDRDYNVTSENLEFLAPFLTDGKITTFSLINASDSKALTCQMLRATIVNGEISGYAVRISSSGTVQLSAMALPNVAQCWIRAGSIYIYK